MRISLPQIEMLYDSAISGDRAKASEMLAVAPGLIAAGFPLPPKLQDWISKGLRRLSLGMSAEEAFQFRKSRRGERKGSAVLLNDNDRQVRALLVELAVQGDGLTVEAAWERVAQVENCSVDTVRNAWNEGHKQATSSVRGS